jgi:predicted dehydrogenase
MKSYRVGIIGFGFIGKVHTYAYANIPLFYEQPDFATRITHLCTAHPESAQRAAELVGASHACTDFRQITDDPDIDIVNICSPNEYHCEALLAAIAHNKHIYCDKPLVANFAEAQKVQAALANYRGIAQMTLQNRFFPATMRAKQLIDEGRIGDILEFRGRYLHSGSADPKTPLRWKLEAGTVADLGSHILDLISYLLGDFAALQAATHIAYPQRPSLSDPNKLLPVQAEDNMIVTAKLPNGAIGSISASKIATGTEDEVSFELHGTKGALRLEAMNWDQLFFYDCSAQNAPLGGLRGWTAIDCGQRYPKPAGFPTPKAAIGWMRGHMHCLYNFLNDVHRGQASGPSLQRGVYIQYLMDKVCQSAQTGKWVALDSP